MRFCLVDRIDVLEEGQQIQAVKLLTLSEEYLSDHFPRFPVMPGVFMLEALTQAGAWLVRATEDFAHSVVTLKEAKGIKYADFVEPGSTLRMNLEWVRSDGVETLLKATGTVEGRPAVSGRLVLLAQNMADTQPMLSGSDAKLIREMRNQFARIDRRASVREPAQGKRDVATQLAAVPAGSTSENGQRSTSFAPLPR